MGLPGRRSGYRRQKCTHTPDGSPGWQCESQASGYVCQIDSPTAGGIVGWRCLNGEFGTSCSRVGAPTPPIGDGDDWSCRQEQKGIVCEGGGSTSPPPPVGGELPKVGDFRTQTQGGWGTKASGNNPGSYRDAHFAAAFADGLTIGCQDGYRLKLTSSKAVEDFLPAGGTPSTLSANLTDATKTSAGVFAGQLVSAMLSVTFDDADGSFGASNVTLGDLVIRDGGCAGMTVRQLIDLANSVIGGCSDLRSPSVLSDCLDRVNNAFVDGERSSNAFASP